MTAHHLAYMRQPYFDMIFDGRKTIESRFSKNKHPARHLKIYDRIWWKLSGGEIKGYSKVYNVIHFENLTPERIKQIKTKLNNRICATDDFWEAKKDSKYATIIFLSDPIIAKYPYTMPTPTQLGWKIIQP